MITSLRLKNFKNFADETLRMGPFTVIVGANASGKSNIRDAFRFLHGIGRLYRLPDVIGGKYGPGGEVVWEEIRGAMNEIIRLPYEPDFTVGAVICDKETELYYSITSRKSYSGSFGIRSEELLVNSEVHFSAQQDDDEILCAGFANLPGEELRLPSDHPVLTQIIDSYHLKDSPNDNPECHATQAALSNMRFLDLSPQKMREPSFRGQNELGNRGENLSTVIHNICLDDEKRKTLIEWTRELTPMDIQDFDFPWDPTDRIQLAFKETSGRTVSAYAASDGTLRFLAVLAALLGKNPAGLYVFEEIDNGIHPSRLRLLVDLIENQTSNGDIQVVTTTHSPELLSMISDETFKNTSVVCRNPDTDDAVIRPIAELPNAEKLRKSQGLGRLHTGGWLENAVWFSEGNAADQGNGA